jgi:signal-transduction protein with cAMP-binding, CBS, and nucleotidyltransferase domain
MKSGYKVYDAMTVNPIVVSPNETVKACVDKMVLYDVGSLLILDKGNKITLTTESDIVKKVIGNNLNPENTKIGTISSSDVFTIEPEKDIIDALFMMRDLEIRHLPVVKNNKLYGILTQKDILKIQPELFELIADKITIREEERKIGSLYKQSSIGVCEVCGEISDELSYWENVLICSDCKKIFNKK